MLIVLFASTGGVQIGAAVVCMGADGHIDVESVFDGCCSPVVHGEHFAGPSLVAATSSCGDCVDVQLRVVPLKTREGSLSSPDTIAGVRSNVSSGGGNCGGRNAISHGVNDRRSQALTFLSTVILLT